MSPVFQNPESPDEFDRIMCGVPVISPWDAMFAEAEETLAEACPEGYDVIDVGRAAFDSLPESEKAAALDVLFYTYWAARQDDLTARARYQTGGAA